MQCLYISADKPHIFPILIKPLHVHKYEMVLHANHDILLQRQIAQQIIKLWGVSFSFPFLLFQGGHHSCRFRRHNKP